MATTNGHGRTATVLAVACLGIAVGLGVMASSDASPPSDDRVEQTAAVEHAALPRQRRSEVARSVTPLAPQSLTAVQDRPDNEVTADDELEPLGVTDDEDVASAQKVRRALLKRNIRSLETAADKAEAEGNPQRAALMQRRIERLSELLDEESNLYPDSDNRAG